MKYGTTKTVSTTILLLALAVACMGQFLCTKGSQEYMLSCYAAIVLLVAGLAVVFIWGRCPYCGKRLMYKFLQWKKCPSCGKALDKDKQFVKPTRLK